MADPITFIVPMLASILQGAIGHGLAANQAANERNEQIRMARARREELQPIIDKLREAGDFFNMEEQLARDLGRAANQIDATAAQTGMTNAGAGGADAVRADLLGGMIAQLAQAKQADEMQRTQLLAEILSDPSLQVAGLTEGNVAGQSILGALLGGATGAATQLSSYLSSEAGIELLKGLGKKNTNIDDMGLEDIFGPGGRRGAGGQAANAWSPSYPDQLGLAASPRNAPGQRGGALPNYYGSNPIRPALW